MDANVALSASYQSFPDVPYQIYSPLYQIAKQGYNADDVKLWYLAMLRHLRQTGIESAATECLFATPCQSNSPDLPAQQLQTPSSGHLRPIDFDTNAHNLDESEKLDLNLWPETFSVPQFDQPQLTIPTSTAQILDNLSQNGNDYVTHLSPAWSPKACVISPVNDPQTTTSATMPTQTYTSNLTDSAQWFSPDAFSAVYNNPRKRSASQSPPYQMAMSNTAMPLLVPRDTSPLIEHSPVIPVTTSTEVTYFPAISIIPSRKRQKKLQKRVRNVIQPMHVQRQSI